MERKIDRLKNALNFFHLKEDYTISELEDAYKSIKKDNYTKRIKEMASLNYKIKKNDYFSKLYSATSKFRNKLNNYKTEYSNNKRVIKICDTYLKKIKRVSSFSKLEKLKEEFNQEIKKILNKEPRKKSTPLILEREINIFEYILNEDILSPSKRISNLAIKYKLMLNKVRTKAELLEMEREYRHQIMLLRKREIRNVLADFLLDYPNNLEVLEIVNKYKRKLDSIREYSEITELNLELLSEIKIFAAERNKEDALIKEKEKFLKELSSIEKDIKDSKFLKRINDYKEYLNYVYTMKDLKELIASFKEEYLFFQNYEERNQKYVNLSIKKDLKRHFTYLCMLYKKNHSANPYAMENANTFLEGLLLLIEETEPDNISWWVQNINEIKFLNIEEDKRTLKDLKPPLPLYIDKINGNILLLRKRTPNEVFYYNLGDRKNYAAPNRYFLKNALSFYNFFKKGIYVGNKKVHLLEDNQREININYPLQDFIWYSEGIMLSVEDNVLKDRFIFYPLTRYARYKDPNWSFSINPNKKDVKNGIYQNPSYIEEVLEDYCRSQLTEDFSRENKKRKN